MADPADVSEKLDEIMKELESINKRLSYIEENTGFRAPVEEIKKEEKEEIKEEEIKKEEIKKEEETEQKVVEEAVEDVQTKKEMNLELDIGRKLFNKLGIISLVVGIAFIVKYGMEQGLLGPIGRIVIGILSGLVLLILGEIFDRKREYTYLARSLTGGSFAVLYITIYFAYHCYNLIPKNIDLGILGIIVALAVFFSLKYNSKVIVSEAFILGYIISLMSAITAFTLIYCLFLTFGLIIIARKRAWGVGLGIGGITATYLIHAGFPIYSEYVISGIFLIACFFLIALFATGIKDHTIGGYVGVMGLLATYFTYLWFPNRLLEEFEMTLIFLIVYFLLFNLLSFFIRETEDGDVNYSNIFLLLLNAAFFYGLFYWKMERFYELYLGLSTLGLAIVYLLFAYLSLGKDLKNLLGTFLVLCITFVTITIPVQVNNELITIFWAVEAFFLLVLGFRFNMKYLRIFSIIVAAITIFKTILIDSTLHQFALSSLLESTRFFAYIVPIITFYASALLYYKNKDKIEEIEKDIETLYIGGATVLVTILLALELSGGDISDAWAIEAFLLLVLGFRFNMKYLRIFSIIIAAIIMYKTLFIDSSLHPFALSSLLESTRFFAYIVPIITFYISALLYHKNRDKLEEMEKDIEMLYIGGATGLVTTILALELRGGYISAAWAGQAIVLLTIGFMYRHFFLRILGISLIGVTTFKVFIFDLAGLETPYRILSFMVLGIILLIASYSYGKYRHIFEE